LTFEEFKAKFQVMHHIARSAMSMVVMHKTQNTRMSTAVLFVDSIDKKAISVANIREIHQHLVDSALIRAILVHEQPLSSGAKRELVAENRRIEAIADKTLKFNPAHHFMVPQIHILKDQEKTEVMQKYKATSEKVLPRLDTSDPVCRYFGIRRGDVVGLERLCETAGTYVSYRVCARPD
jgi:DNA-directed RNA polymerase I, II, and III subunit RPABC1